MMLIRCSLSDALGLISMRLTDARACAGRNSGMNWKKMCVGEIFSYTRRLRISWRRDPLLTFDGPPATDSPVIISSTLIMSKTDLPLPVFYAKTISSLLPILDESTSVSDPSAQATLLSNLDDLHLIARMVTSLGMWTSVRLRHTVNKPFLTSFRGI